MQQQTTYAFIGMCKHYLPTAPVGCGIRCIRVSQDALEAYFNYLRSCGGSNVHPTLRELLSRAAGRAMTAALSKSANNGMRGRKKTKVLDEVTAQLSLRGRPGGAQQKKARAQKLKQ